MDDNQLLRLLTDADARFQTAARGDARPPESLMEFVDAVRDRRRIQIRRRQRLGALAVLFFILGLAGWSWNRGSGLHSNGPRDAIASSESVEQSGAPTADAPTKERRLRDDEIARLTSVIAALDAEANRVRQFVELYRAAEARREMLAAGEPAPAEPLLPPDVVAQLEIDRAAAITVISADSQASEFNRLDEAAESYRSVLQHFPDSRWASVARDRLAQVQLMN